MAEGNRHTARAPVVLQVLPALHSGGVERGTVDITKALTDRGWRALVASSGGPMVKDVERAGGRHLTLPLASKNPLVMLRNSHRLMKAIRQENVDIVHARSRAPAWSAYRATQRRNCHFVTTFHSPYNDNAIKHSYNAVMEKGDRVIAISAFIAQHILNNYAVDPAKLVTVPRGVDIDHFNPDLVNGHRLVALTEAWRIDDSKPVILLPGRLTRWKGQPVLIQALTEMARQDVQCVFVGSDQGRTEYRQSLLDLAAAHGLNDRVRFADHCRDMPAAYLVANLVVSASTEPEGFGRVSAEAQAMGRLIVATDHGGSRETVLNGRTGWLVPPGDSKAMAEILDHALSLPAPVVDAAASAARAHIVENFSLQQMREKTLGVYASLLDSAEPASLAVNHESGA